MGATDIGSTHVNRRGLLPAPKGIGRVTAATAGAADHRPQLRSLGATGD